MEVGRNLPKLMNMIKKEILSRIICTFKVHQNTLEEGRNILQILIQFLVIIILRKIIHYILLEEIQ